MTKRKRTKRGEPLRPPKPAAALIESIGRIREPEEPDCVTRMRAVAHDPQVLAAGLRDAGVTRDGDEWIDD